MPLARGASRIYGGDGVAVSWLGAETGRAGPRIATEPLTGIIYTCKSTGVDATSLTPRETSMSLSTPTELQLAILRAVWERGEATGADVQEMLARPATASPTGYAGHEDGGRLGSLSDDNVPFERADRARWS